MTGPVKIREKLMLVDSWQFLISIWLLGRAATGGGGGGGGGGGVTTGGGSYRAAGASGGRGM